MSLYRKYACLSYIWITTKGTVYIRQIFLILEGDDSKKPHFLKHIFSDNVWSLRSILGTLGAVDLDV
jgi:hypothetical protein